MRFIDASADPWLRRDGGEQANTPLLPFHHALLTLEQWRAAREHWPDAFAVGVALANTDEVDDLAADLHRLALVTLEFPKWTDGRAYSQARLLRARMGYHGEVRATGEVLVDMLPLLQRNGFDAALLRADQSIDAARRALRFFAAHYQGDALQSRPLFARIEA